MLTDDEYKHSLIILVHHSKAVDSELDVTLNLRVNKRFTLILTACVVPNIPI